MKISSVSMVSPVNRYNNVNFQSKKTQENSNDSYISKASHKLAIPLAATVLAMSPMSSRSTNIEINDDITDNIEMYEPDVNQQAKKEELISVYRFPEEINRRSYELHLYDMDGNKDNAEKVILRQYWSSGPNSLMMKDTDLKHLKVNYSVDKSTNKVDTTYYAVGKTTMKKSQNGTTKVLSNSTMQLIPKAVYQYLNKTLGGAIETKIERTEKTDDGSGYMQYYELLK